MCYVVFWRWLNKIIFDMNEFNEIVVNTLLWTKDNMSSALVFERDYKIRGNFD